MATAPPCPFGASWDALTLARLRAFLATRPPERAVWEAKSQGTKGQLAEFVRKEVCGFANRQGGYLLVGAHEFHDGGWTLSGVRLPRVRELHDWIASLLRELQPAPLFDVHEWALDDGSKVAVIQIEAADLRPVSYNATVYLRHGSQTIRADGNAIRRLAADGERAEKRLLKAARDDAKRSIDQLFTPFGVAIVRPGSRQYRLDDPAPEQALYRELERALAGRYRQRTRTRMEWGTPQGEDFKKFGLKERPQRTFRGWRASWMTEQATPGTICPA